MAGIVINNNVINDSNQIVELKNEIKELKELLQKAPKLVYSNTLTSASNNINIDYTFDSTKVYDVYIITEGTSAAGLSWIVNNDTNMSHYACLKIENSNKNIGGDQAAPGATWANHIGRMTSNGAVNFHATITYYNGQLFYNSDCYNYNTTECLYQGLFSNNRNAFDKYTLAFSATTTTFAKGSRILVYEK